MDAVYRGAAKQHHVKVLLDRTVHTLGPSTDLKFRTTLYSIINSTTGKYCSVTFIVQSHLKISSTVRTTLYSIITAPQESTAQYLSFEWSHFRISSTDSKVRTTLYSVINSTTGEYVSKVLTFEGSECRVSSTK